MYTVYSMKKRINTHAKGKRLELLARKKLEEEGYTIAFKSVFVRFQNIDFAGLFDIVAYRNRVWKFIQVKSKKNNKVMNELREWTKKHAPFYTIVELWVWDSKKKDFDVYQI